MTLVNLKVHQVLYILQVANNIECTWPNFFSSDAEKLAFILNEIKWGLSLLIVISVMIGTMRAVYYQIHDLTVMMKAASQFFALFEITCNLILSKLQSTRVKHLLEELNNVLRSFNHHERKVLQKYINRYSDCYTLIVIWHVIAIIAFSCGPILLPIKLPAETQYPFSIESSTVLAIIYATHVYSIILTGFGISMDFMFSMFFCCSSANLEILWTEIQNTLNEKQIKLCVKRHQEIIKFVYEAGRIVRYILFKTNITMGAGIICAAFPVIHVQSSESSFQFICMVVGAYQRLLITAWPADDLKENSERFAFELYKTPWYEKSKFIVKDILFMIQRCQKPLVIGMGALLPLLSLEYYLRYITTVFSYFATMRAIFDS